ncbi:MAG TPA: MarR family winged helix-turn-helix transcriptional regulator [Candidatus Limnocylindria bacterium]|nr:MarR family winged helix-turn-helix transcriptional regulator [Candidatus Limnocylindria bacterium]
MPDQAGVTLARYRSAVQACAVMNFRQAARSVTAYFDEQLRPARLRATQLNLLMAIEVSAAPTVTDLAEILGMDRTTMTRNLKLLRDRGLVARHRIALTEKGRRSAAAALPLWEKAQAQILRSLGERRWAALLGELAAAKASVQSRSRVSSRRVPS